MRKQVGFDLSREQDLKLLEGMSPYDPNYHQRLKKIAYKEHLEEQIKRTGKLDQRVIEV
jgi:GH43 family beta-xylosidase